MTAEERCDELLASAYAGDLMTRLTAPEHAGAEHDLDIASLSEMHRQGRLDVFEHLGRPPGVDEWRLDFGAWSKTYVKLVPVLDGDAERVVAVIDRLETPLWAPAVQDAFIEWCARDRRRIDGVLALEDRPAVKDWFFTAAMISAMRVAPADYMPVAVEYAEGRRRARIAGIRGIAMMSTEDNALTREGVAVLIRVVDAGTAPDGDLTGAFRGALEVASRSEAVDDLVKDMVTKAITAGQAELLSICCHALATFRGEVRGGLIASLLDALAAIDIDDVNTCRAADSAVHSLLRRGKTEAALDSLDGLLRKSRAERPLDSLRLTVSHLTHSEPGLLPAVICRWLDTGESELCSAACDLLFATGNLKFIFDFDPGNGSWTPGRTIFVARKAVGWLMPHATGPASFLVCLLRNACPQAAAEIARLLFDPLLVNYPLSTREYLDGICPVLPELAKAKVKDVLGTHDRYRQAIDAAADIAEMQTSERHRWIEARRQYEAQLMARREADRKSVVRQIASTKTILYGTRTICYVPDLRGGSNRHESPMRTFSVVTDNPMGWVYDPFELEFMRWKFRVQRKTQ